VVKIHADGQQEWCEDGLLGIILIGLEN